MNDEQREKTKVNSAHRLIAYGPVPSRRLGRSLGINNIPPKVCTYACVYCQVGRTLKLQIDRQAFYDTEQIFTEVKRKIETTAQSGDPIDYLTIVSDGEPTLDVNLGSEIDALRPLGVKIAVITNASLLWRDDVVEDLKRADWVSVKVDSVMETSWRRLNRPHAKLQFSSILNGLHGFAASYGGELVTETMLVKGVNDDPDSMNKLAQFLAQINPAKAYLSIPTRPPLKQWVEPPGEYAINRAYQILRNRLDRVECLMGHEGNTFAFSGNVEEDLLAITAVHPMREEAVQALLAKANSDWSLVQRLLDEKLLIETQYDGKIFYMRRLQKECCE